MTDYTETGEVPAEEREVEDPPTVDEVLERQRIEYPEQAESSTQPVRAESATSEEVAVAEAGGDPTGGWTDGTPDVEGSNSA